MKARLSVLTFIISVLASGAQAAGPQLSCTMPAMAAYPAAEADPAIAIWHDGDMEKSMWQPPGCTGWSPSSHSKLVIAVAASFHFDGPIDQLLNRVGRISALSNMLYWSTTDKKWRPLAYDSSALSGTDIKNRRGDFLASDLTKGASLHYWEDDTRSGEIVYHLKVLESTPDRVVIVSENVTPIRRFFITLFEPGALQTVLSIQRLSPGVFGVYMLSRTGEGSSAFAAGHDESYINRAVAFYRQIAGIKTDKEPPAAQ